MSATAMASSSSPPPLNPNAPLFIPAAYRRVEDFSPEWWGLVHTTAWFRDHWFRQHRLHYDDDVDEQDEEDHDAALAALPDDLLDTDDLLFFHAPDRRLQHRRRPGAEAALARGGAPSPWDHHQQPRHAGKPPRHVGIKAAAPRVIHQPR